MSDIFLDPVITPIYYYLLGYLVLFLFLILPMAHLRSDEKRLGSYEASTHLGWFLGFIFHLIAGIILVAIFPIYKALNASYEWGMITLYAIIYVLVMIVDILFIIALFKSRALDQVQKGS
jgi:hypothetical protein